MYFGGTRVYKASSFCWLKEAFFYVERNQSVREGGWRQAVAFVPPEPWKRVLDLVVTSASMMLSTSVPLTVFEEKGFLDSASLAASPTPRSSMLEQILVPLWSCLLRFSIHLQIGEKSLVSFY